MSSILRCSIESRPKAWVAQQSQRQPRVQQNAEQVLGMRALDALQTWAKRTYRGADCESALDQITISDDAGECGNRRIGKACSAHLRNSRTDRMHMVSPKWGITTGLWLPSATCPIPSCNGMCPGPP